MFGRGKSRGRETKWAAPICTTRSSTARPRRCGGWWPPARTPKPRTWTFGVRCTSQACTSRRTASPCWLDAGAEIDPRDSQRATPRCSTRPRSRRGRGTASSRCCGRTPTRTTATTTGTRRWRWHARSPTSRSTTGSKASQIETGPAVPITIGTAGPACTEVLGSSRTDPGMNVKHTGGRRCSGPRAGRGRVSRRGDLQGAGHLPVRVLRGGVPAALGARSATPC